MRTVRPHRAGSALAICCAWTGAALLSLSANALDLPSSPARSSETLTVAQSSFSDLSAPGLCVTGVTCDNRIFTDAGNTDARMLDSVDSLRGVVVDGGANAGLILKNGTLETLIYWGLGTVGLFGLLKLRLHRR